MQYPSPGFNDVSAYLASGLPYVTASAATTTPLKISFPYITKFITIRAGGNLDIGFTSLGTAGSNHYSMINNQYLTFDVRVKEMYLKKSSGGGSVNFYLVAGLTGIPTGSIPTLTGSFVFDASDPYFTGSATFQNYIVYDPGLG
jgi:hypothetical protein